MYRHDFSSLNNAGGDLLYKYNIVRVFELHAKEFSARAAKES